MAFCNSCGATLDTGAKFCNKCGATQATAAVTPATSTPAGSAPPAKGGSSALKIILIVVGIIVLLGILAIGSVIGFGVWIAKKSHVEERNGKVKIESPILNMETSTDPEEAARNIGVEIYPGAHYDRNSSASVTIAGIHTTTAVLETDDAPSVVADFYRSRMPNTRYSTNQGDTYSMMTGDNNDMTTVNIQGYDGKTRIQISRVTKGN